MDRMVSLNQIYVIPDHSCQLRSKFPSSSTTDQMLLHSRTFQCDHCGSFQIDSSRGGAALTQSGMTTNLPSLVVLPVAAILLH